MTRFTATVAAFSLAAFALVFTARPQAQDLNPLEKTYLTFSAPVEMPGITLPAGTYTFKLADTSGRNVVQVLSRDEKTVHGQFLFVQAQRPEATGDTVVMFKETAEGTTPAVQYWYYPGERIGKEFVYPRDQALRIATRTRSTVLAAEGELSANSRVNAITPEGQTTPIEQPRTQPAPAQQARVEPPAQQAPAPSAPAFQNQPAPAAPREAASQSAAAELPATAGLAPPMALLGALSLAAALGVRGVRG